MTAITASVDRTEGSMTAEERLVIFASSLGTVFEWYDFYIYGTLTAILAPRILLGVNPSAAFIFTLLAFAAGFAVRPFGALFFGRLGDLIGRKYTFLITMTLMGLGTFCIGLLPNYASLGHRGAGHADLPAAVPGAGARRRIRRRGDLRRRACAQEQARLLHVVDSDNGDARPVHGVADRPRRAALISRAITTARRLPTAPSSRPSTIGAGAFRSCCRRSCSWCRSGSGSSSTSRRCSCA